MNKKNPIYVKNIVFVYRYICIDHNNSIMSKRKSDELPNEFRKKKPKKPKKKRIEIEQLELPSVKLTLPKFKLQNVVASKFS